MDVLCTFKIKIESQNLVHLCIKYQLQYSNHDQDSRPQSGTSSVLQSHKSGLKGHGYFLHLQNQDRAKMWIISVSKTRDHIQIKIKKPNPYNVFQCPKVGLDGLECSLHLQNQDGEPKFRTRV